MTWILIYEDGLNYRKRKNFDTEEELDSWLKEHQDESLPKYETVNRIFGIYKCRQTKDLPGMTVSVYPTPRITEPLCRYLITAVDYITDKEALKGLFPDNAFPDIAVAYALKGKLLDTDDTPDEEESTFAVMSDINLKGLLDDKNYSLENEKNWATPTISMPLTPYRNIVSLKTNVQEKEWKDKKNTENQRARIRKESRRLPYPTGVFLIKNDDTCKLCHGDNDNYAWIVDPHPSDSAPDATRQKIYIRQDGHFEADLKAFTVFVGKIREILFPKPEQPIFNQLDLFNQTTESYVTPQ